MHFDPFDAIALIFGVIFTLRKLDAQSRNAAQQPQVAPEDFERWQRQTISAYLPGSYGSFFREAFHLGFGWYVNRHAISAVSYRHIGVLVDAVWFLSVVATLVLAHLAREQAKKLSISLDRPEPTRGA